MIEIRCSQCGKIHFRKKVHPKSINHFCDRICKGEWQKDQRRKQGFTKEWIYEQYWTLGKSADQIAKEINKDPKSVWKWMKNEDKNKTKRNRLWQPIKSRSNISL